MLKDGIKLPDCEKLKRQEKKSKRLIVQKEHDNDRDNNLDKDNNDINNIGKKRWRK